MKIMVIFVLFVKLQLSPEGHQHFFPFDVDFVLGKQKYINNMNFDCNLISLIKLNENFHNISQMLGEI
jgi:hypothetical protein